MRRAMLLALVLILASLSTAVAAESQDAQLAELEKLDLCEYFPQTDKYLCFGFRAYWHQFGGLEIFGYPITNEFVEDGMTVQYFQRTRLEWHPGVWPERHDVLQGLLGVELTTALAGTGPFAWADEKNHDCVYFAVTGHNVCGKFLKRWQMSGGLPVFGYPISEAYEHDGMLIQYFQRQRMEHQPGVWPERHDVLLGLIGVEVYTAAPPPPPPPGPEVTVLAEGLHQPRHIEHADDGADTDHGIYVAEAGVGGDQCETVVVEFEGEEEEIEVCVGLTGAVTKVTHDGEQTRVAEGLPSITVFEEIGGPHGVTFDSDGNMYVTIGIGFELTPEIRDLFGDAGELLGTIIRVDGPGEFTVIADLLEYEFAENPDEGLLDSNPYGIATDGDDLIAVDAGGNSLLRVTQEGEISVIAIFPERLVPAPPFIPEDEIPMDAVPTDVVVGSDGNFYVSQLTGFPFPQGGARVYQVTPGGDVTIHADGFTNIGALAFDSQGRLVVLEIVAGGLLEVDEDAIGAGDLSSVASRIVRIEADGSQTTLDIPGVFFATGLAIDEDDALYIVHLSVTPGAQLVKVVLP